MVGRQTVAQPHCQIERLGVVHLFEGSTHAQEYTITDGGYGLLSDKLLGFGDVPGCQFAKFAVQKFASICTCWDSTAHDQRVGKSHRFPTCTRPPKRSCIFSLYWLLGSSVPQHGVSPR